MHVDRRRLVHGTLLSSFGAWSAFPSVGATRKRAGRIGVLGQGRPESQIVERLRSELARSGKTVTLETRWAHHDRSRLAALARELVESGVDVIVIHGDKPAVVAAIEATRTIPIFFLWIGDPVGQDLVRSLNQPGGNVTGLSFLGPQLEVKRLELLRQSVPSLKRVAVITNSETPDAVDSLRFLRSAANSMRLELVVFDLRTEADLPGVLERTALARVDGVLVQEDFLRDDLVEASDSPIGSFVLRNRLPLAAPGNGPGVLLSYAFNWQVHFRQAGRVISRLLSGTRPTDIPVEQPVSFRLTVNQRTARAVGITIPATVLLQADKVIE